MLAYRTSLSQKRQRSEQKSAEESKSELPAACHLLMDCAFEGNKARQLALDLDFIPVVPPHPNRVEPRRLKKALYRRPNDIRQLFRRLKGFRRIFSCFDKRDLVFIAFIYFALIIEGLR